MASLVTYTNTDQRETTRLGMRWEWSTSVTVRREGRFTRTGLEDVDDNSLPSDGEGQPDAEGTEEEPVDQDCVRSSNESNKCSYDK